MVQGKVPIPFRHGWKSLVFFLKILTPSAKIKNLVPIREMRKSFPYPTLDNELALVRIGDSVVLKKSLFLLFSVKRETPVLRDLRLLRCRDSVRIL